jgi:uncharacterized membrane protein
VLPFTTSFLNAYITFKFAIVVYWVNICLLGLILYLGWIYAEKHDFLSVYGAEKEQVGRAIKRRIMLAETLYLIGALLCFISTYLSIAVIILFQLYSTLALFSRIRNKHDRHKKYFDFPHR